MTQQRRCTVDASHGRIGAATPYGDHDFTVVVGPSGQRMRRRHDVLAAQQHPDVNRTITIAPGTRIDSPWILAMLRFLIRRLSRKTVPTRWQWPTLGAHRDDESDGMHSRRPMATTRRATRRRGRRDVRTDSGGALGATVTVNVQRAPRRAAGRLDRLQRRRQLGRTGRADRRQRARCRWRQRAQFDVPSSAGGDDLRSLPAEHRRGTWASGCGDGEVEDYQVTIAPRGDRRSLR